MKAFIFALLAVTNAITKTNFTEGYYLALCGYTLNHNNYEVLLPHAVSSYSLLSYSGGNAYALSEQTILQNESISSQFTVDSTLDAFNTYYKEMRDDIYFYGRVLINPSNTDKIRPEAISTKYLPYAPTQMECDASVATLNYSSSRINVVITSWNLAQDVTELTALRNMMRDDLLNGTRVDSASYYQAQLKGVVGEWYQAQVEYVISDNDFSEIYRDFGNPNEWSNKYKQYMKCFNYDESCFWLYGMKAITSNEEVKRKWLKWPEVDTTTKSPSNDNGKSEKKDNSARVVGIIVLVLVIIGVVTGAIWCILKKRKEKKQLPPYGNLLDENQYAAM